MTYPVFPSSWLIQAVKEKPLLEMSGTLGVVTLIDPPSNNTAALPTLPGMPTVALTPPLKLPTWEMRSRGTGEEEEKGHVSLH